MSVKVEHLSKIYGEQAAVSSLSFEAKNGEVLGFLGPNGAGKTTTMKIISCFIPQTEGSVSVCGFDTASQGMEVRRLIGYLPENNPLYKEMYVKEYLGFMAGLHKISDSKKRIEEMVEMTGLQDEQKKVIGTLSKGYRQRVGLAQAMIHDPEVLILDEPTSGLDPNQLVEIRALIKKIGKKKTVIFSTHIMQEVQAICDRVLIINKGEMVANDPIDRLQERIRGGSKIIVQFLEKTTEKKLLQIAGVKKANEDKMGRWHLNISGNKDLRPDIFRFAVENNLTLIEMQKEQFTVEDVFQKLTKSN